jgi:GGDEF domain-containing protein
MICSNFKHSPVFRIGGDEFAVLLKGQDFDNRDSLMKKLWVMMIENKTSGLVTVAGGISRFKRGQDIRMQDVFERADQAMYVNKQQLKGI